MPACCFSFASARSAEPSSQLPSAIQPTSDSEDIEGGDLHAVTPRSGRSVATSTSPTTFNLLSHEFSLIQTDSYAEIWSKIHAFTSSSAVPAEQDQLRRTEGEDGWAAPCSTNFIQDVLRPDRGFVDEALSASRPGRLSRLVSAYFDHSEHTSRICLRLHRCVDRARAVYKPLLDLIDVLSTPVPTPPSSPVSSPLSSSSPFQNHYRQSQVKHRHHLTQAQCERVFDTFLKFSTHGNPFPASGATEEDGISFQEVRRRLTVLKQQLDHLLRQSHARLRLLRRTTAGCGLCLVLAVVGITVSGILLAVHALPALATAPLLCILSIRPTARLTGSQRRLRGRIAQLDATAKGTFMLNHDIDTIERLVARLHERVESDRALVNLVLSRGCGDYHPIEHVVGQLRRDRRGLLEQLQSLEEHVCLCFAAINRARSLLIQHINSHHKHPHYHGHSGEQREDATSSSATKEEVEKEEEEGQV